MAAGLDRFQRILQATLDRAHAVGYSGYSKFDALLSPVTETLSFGWWPLRLVWTQVVKQSPVNLRPLLRVRKGVNPEAPALFARANLDCMETRALGSHAERAIHCLEWLLAHDSTGSGDYRGRCWGYHHSWQSPGFYQPPNYPNCYVTCIVTDALLHGYRILARKEYLDAARSAADFILHDLPVFCEDEREKCIAYVPTMRNRLRVININALAGAVLAEIGRITGEDHLLEQARKLLNFVVRNQTPYGAWFYTTDPGQSLVTHDNYHTGMILDALLTYERTTGDGHFHESFSRGLDYYREHLFLPDGAPKWTNSRVWPHDVHGSSQGTLTFALAGDRETSLRVATWGVDHFYKGDGDFEYQRGRYINRRFTLLHWCNGWMARGLAALLRSSGA